MNIIIYIEDTIGQILLYYRDPNRVNCGVNVYNIICGNNKIGVRGIRVHGT